MATEVVWMKLAIIGVPGMECEIKTTKDGRTLDADGDPIEPTKRAYVCGGDGRWMLGSIFLCQKHAAETARLMDDDIDEIEREWRAQL